MMIFINRDHHIHAATLRRTGEWTPEDTIIWEAEEGLLFAEELGGSEDGDEHPKSCLKTEKSEAWPKRPESPVGRRM